MGACQLERQVDIFITDSFLSLTRSRRETYLWNTVELRRCRRTAIPSLRLFRSKVMGIPENYDDEAERVRTRPQLLPKPKEAGVVPSAGLQVLAKALGVKDQDHDRQDVRGRPHQ